MTDEEKFAKVLASKTERAGEHLIWKAGLTSAGQPRVKFLSRDYRVVQAVRRYVQGQPIEGFNVYTTCDEPLCVAPEHVRATPRGRGGQPSNVDRGVVDWSFAKDRSWTSAFIQKVRWWARKYDVEEEDMAQQAFLWAAGRPGIAAQPPGVAAASARWLHRQLHGFDVAPVEVDINGDLVRGLLHE